MKQGRPGLMVMNELLCEQGRLQRILHLQIRVHVDETDVLIQQPRAGPNAKHIEQPEIHVFLFLTWARINTHNPRDVPTVSGSSEGRYQVYRLVTGIAVRCPKCSARHPSQGLMNKLLPSTHKTTCFSKEHAKSMKSSYVSRNRLLQHV